jgi:hypothetical protein
MEERVHEEKNEVMMKHNILINLVISFLSLYEGEVVKPFSHPTHNVEEVINLNDE